jgi:fluoroacetyl-CoA thioesterase
MKDSSIPCLTFELKFTVPENKTVPHLHPESPESQAMPKVSYEK